MLDHITANPAVSEVQRLGQVLSSLTYAIHETHINSPKKCIKHLVARRSNTTSCSDHAQPAAGAFVPNPSQPSWHPWHPSRRSNESPADPVDGTAIHALSKRSEWIRDLQTSLNNHMWNQPAATNTSLYSKTSDISSALRFHPNPKQNSR